VSPRARETEPRHYEGDANGARVSLILVDTAPGTPAGVPHGFVNSGSEQLRMVAIHVSPTFVTEWLE
jgi:mannose-6-phosphate isomerase-like protein (cupin superfamily)